MKEVLAPNRFVRAVGLSIDTESLQFTHDYGEISLAWDSIAYTFAVILKKKKAPQAPLFIMMQKDTPGFFYIDGNLISTRYLKIDNEEDRPPPSEDDLEDYFLYLKKNKEDGFRKLIKEICTHAAHAFVDKPVLAYLREGQLFLPTFSTQREIADYCRRTISAAPDEATRGPVVLESGDDALKKLTDSTEEREEWKAGTILDGRYTVQEVHRGGMGTVYIVFDSEDVRFYAMKTFQERYLWDEKVVKQFIKEAEIWINLEHHPNIVKAELVKIIEGKPYILLEYVQGTDLEKLIRKEPQSLRSSIQFAIQLCEGMNYAFNKLSLIHRDLKPSNCLVTREGILKITDFGLGKVFDDAPVEGELVAIPRKKTRKKISTSSSTAMAGTLPFMAPELFANLSLASIKTDIYAFGVVLYMLLTGNNPFYSDDPLEVITNQMSIVPDSPMKLNAEVPEPLADIVMKCLEKDPGERLGDFALIKSGLEEIYHEAFGSRYVHQLKESDFSEEDWINKGISLASINHHREAIITFDQAVGINPRSLKARIYKGASLIQFGKILEALVCIGEGMKIDKQSWELWFYKGEAYWKLGNIEDALLCYDMAIDLTLERAPVFGRKGRLLAEIGKYDRALICYNHALGQNPRSADIWDEKGDLLISMKNYEASLDCFRESLQINPRSKQAWYHKGLALTHLGCFSEALEAQEKALSIDGEFGDAYACLGDCYRELANGREALNAYSAAIKIQPDNSAAYLSCIMLLKESGLWEDALENIDRALEIDPDNRRLFIERAEVLFRLGYYEESLSLCQVVLDIEPRNEDARLLQATVKRISDQPDLLVEAAGHVTPEGTKNGSCQSDLNSLLCFFLNFDDALANLEQDNSSDGIVNYLKACLFFIVGEYEVSLDFILKSLLEPAIAIRAKKLQALADERLENQRIAATKKKGFIRTIFKKNDKDEKDAEELLIIGLERFQKGIYREAQNCLRDSLAKDPTLIAGLFYLNKICHYEGDRERSALYWDNYCQSAPHSPGFWREKLASHRPSNPRETEELYFSWIGAYPENLQPWIGYLIFLFDGGQILKLSRILARLLDDNLKPLPINRGSTAFWRLSGIFQLFLGRYRDAQRSFSRALENKPDDVATLAGMGKSLEMREDFKGALEYYHKLIDCEETFSIGNYFLSEIYLKQGYIDKPMLAIDNALEKDPQCIFLMHKKAEILFLIKSHAELSSYSQKIYSVDPSFIPIKILRSMGAIDSQRVDDAIVELTNVLASNKDDFIVLRSLAFLSLHSQQFQKAITIFDQLISLHDLDHELFLGKGIAFYNMDYYEQALDCLKSSIELNPSDPDLWQYLAAVHFHLNNRQESLNCWDKALRHRSRFIQAWVNKGILYYLMADYARAQEISDRAIRMDSSNFNAWLCRARCQLKTDKLDEAIKSIEKALSISPGSAECWVIRGIIDFHRSDFEMSLRSFEKAAEMESKNADLFYNKALLALTLENKAEAKRAIDRSLAINPNHFESLITRFIFETRYDNDAPSQLVLTKAQQVNAGKFEDWSALYQDLRDPLDPLNPIEMASEPFALPLMPSMRMITPLDVFHLMDVK
jgi:eukaryotic-like serine/threonine-protein kinase